MPELPEVETVARDLDEALSGETIAEVVVHWPRTVATPSPEELVRRLVGQVVLGVGRRGKFLVVQLSHGVLLVHLRMTGQLLLEASCAPARLDRHVHLVLRFASGRALCYRDVRKFGRFYLVDRAEAVTACLGPEPLAGAFTPAAFQALLAGRRRRLKDLLLDQRHLAGLGNIYVDEALWEACLSPRRTAATLTEDEVGRLHAAIQRVLLRGIANRGTTLSDFRDPSDRRGQNQDWLHVYGRAAQPCSRCETRIVREVVGGRSSHTCPACQRH